MEAFLQYALPIVLGLGIGVLIIRIQSSRRLAGLIELPWEEFKKNMRKGQLIDIRREGDRKKDKIKGARAFRPRYLLSKNQTKVRKDLPVYLYCKNGKKSKKAGRKMLKKGYSKVYILSGGYPAGKKTAENGR